MCGRAFRKVTRSRDWVDAPALRVWVVSTVLRASGPTVRPQNGRRSCRTMGVPTAGQADAEPRSATSTNDDET